MTNIKSKLILSVAVLILAGASAASAQMGFGSVVNFESKESFVVKDKTFPAGSYVITQTPSLADSSSLMILRGEGKSIVFDSNTARVLTASDDTKIIFDNVNGTLFLSKVFVSGETTGIVLPKTKSARELIAAATTPVREVVISTSGLSL
jgi:hypothetical protein